MFFSEYSFEPLSFFEEKYDENFKLLYMKRNSDNDLIFNLDTEMMHPLLTSIEYAVMLLSSGSDSERACDIISVCTALQYKALGNDSYGLFPYYSETHNKPIHSEIYANTVSFKIGVHLFYILKNYREAIPPRLADEVHAALYRLLFQLANFNNIDYSGSFMQFVQTYLLLAGGDLLKDENFFHSGTTCLRYLCDNIHYHENYHEYNSFYEISIISEILSELKTLLIDKKVISMIDGIYNILWANISQNFHSDFLTLTGPVSNTSRMVPHSYFLYFLSAATQIPFECEESSVKPKILSRCPKKYLSEFFGPIQKKFIQNFVSKGKSYPGYSQARIASNYICEDFTVGTFNSEDFFFETTPFKGYFRSSDSKNPYSFTLEVLNGGHSLLLANFHSVQYNSTVLGAVNFSDNRGNIHYTYSPKNGILPLNDFKIRFKISGDVGKLDIAKNDSEIIVGFKNVHLRFKIPYIKIDNLPIEFTLTKNEHSLYYDALIGRGLHHDVKVSELKEAICQFIFQIKHDALFDDCKCYSYGDKFVGELTTDEYSLKTETAYKPSSFENIMSNDRQYINKTTLADYVTFTNTKARQYRFIVQSLSNATLPDLTDSREFSAELSSLDTAPITMLSTKIKKILRLLARENFALNIFKHYSIHIITALFERVKHENFQFEQLINAKYSEIFRRISYLSDKKRIIVLIRDITDEIQKECIELRPHAHNQSIVSDIIKIMEKNYADANLSLSYLSEETGLSEPYISKQFKAVTGMNYMKYLTKMRMEKAAELLLSGVSAETVSEKCGYTNVYTFKRTFKQYTGKSVSKWMK